MIETRPRTPEDVTYWESLQPANAQLPIPWDDGSFTLTNLSAHCAGCDCNDFPDAHLRASFTWVSGSVLSVHGQVFCHRCILFTTFAWRIRSTPDSPVILEGYGKDGQWGQWTFRQSWVVRLRRAMNRLFSR